MDAQPHVSYNQLRAWIEAQETYERQNGRAAPLSEEQRRAMAVLVPAPTALPVWDAAREARTDWISLLMQYEQTRPNKDAVDRAEFLEEPVPRANGAPALWRCRCRLPREAPTLLFPQVPTAAAAALGRDTDDDVFVRKKDAKKFAAQCAVKWLMAHHYMRTDGGGGGSSSSSQPWGDGGVVAVATAAKSSSSSSSLSSSSSSSSSSASSAAGEESMTLEKYRARLSQPAQKMASPADNSQKADDDAAAAAPAATAAQQKTGSKVSSMATWQGSADKRRRGSDGSESSSVRSLRELCQTLGLAMPELRVTTDSGLHSDFFNGRAVFPPQKNRAEPVVLPADVGVAEMVYTRAATREKLAQSVLAYLTAHERALG